MHWFRYQTGALVLHNDPTLPPLSAAPCVVPSYPFRSPLRLISPLTATSTASHHPPSLSPVLFTIKCTLLPGECAVLQSRKGGDTGRQLRGKLPAQTENTG